MPQNYAALAPSGQAPDLDGITAGLPPLMTSKEAAAFLRLSEHRLRVLRSNGGGPPWMRAGERRVVYPAAALVRWIASR
jgi:hypothetical protein